MRKSANPLIYLASASPRRSALLSQIGVAHRVRPVDIDERQLPGELPRAYVERLARAKAQMLWERLDSLERAPVIGSDTAVAIGTEILGKPCDEADAVRMLQLLSGRVHDVHTGVALRHAAGCVSCVSTSRVTFRALDVQEIVDYWRTGEPADKAGGYAIQGHAARFVAHIEGSYTGIVGLPLFETSELLRSIESRADGVVEHDACVATDARHGTRG